MEGKGQDKGSSIEDVEEAGLAYKLPPFGIIL
jgi:hypothetical protein